jgi:hypothetical protein
VPSALRLLVAGVRADDEELAVTLDHTALLTHRLHGGADLHR